MPTRRAFLFQAMAAAMMPKLSVSPQNLEAIAATTPPVSGTFPVPMLIRRLCDEDATVTLARILGRPSDEIIASATQREGEVLLTNIAKNMAQVHGIFEALANRPDATQAMKEGMQSLTSDGFGDDLWLDEIRHLFDGWPYEGGEEKIAELRQAFYAETQALFDAITKNMTPEVAKRIKATYFTAKAEFAKNLPTEFSNHINSIKQHFTSAIREGIKQGYISVKLEHSAQGITIDIGFSDEHPLEGTGYMLPTKDGGMRLSTFESLNVPLFQMKQMQVINEERLSLREEDAQQHISDEVFHERREQGTAAYFAEHKTGTVVALSDVFEPKKEGANPHWRHKHMVITSNEPIMREIARDIARHTSKQALFDQVTKACTRFSSISPVHIGAVVGQSKANAPMADQSEQVITYKLTFAPPQGSSDILEFNNTVGQIRAHVEGLNTAFPGVPIQWNERARSLTFALEPEQAPALQAQLDQLIKTRDKQ